MNIIYSALISLFIVIIVRADDGDSSDWENYVAASTNDLIRLQKIECEFLDNLDKWLSTVKQGKIKPTPAVQSDVHLIEKAFEELQLSQWRNGSEEYAFHPINAFNLLKRTASFWPDLIDTCSSPSIDDFVEEHLALFPALDDFLYGGCVGLINIELYYNATILELAQGKVYDPASGKVFEAKHGLTSDDCLLIANAAKRIWRFDKYVQWIEGAIEVATKLEGKSSMATRKLTRMLNEAKELHDDVIMKLGINPLKHEARNEKTPDGQPASPLFTEMYPYDEELHEIPSFKKAKKKYKSELDVARPFVNLRPFDHKDGRYMDKSFYRMRTAMLKYSKKLCQGNSSFRPAHLDAKLKCICLHYGNPYLKLGPFKYEPLNEDPHVGIYRDFFTHNEMNELVDDSQDKLHSTIFYGEDGPNYYTSQRISKRRHLYDDDLPLALSASRRISLATRWSVHQSHLASEHYHLINYGIGGQIEVHADYWGPGKYDSHPGGVRTVTFLGYASSTLSGGYTIFPGLGLHVKPQKGDSLFWLTTTNNHDYDSRMFHMGCPVVYGNKWVFTKWLYSDDQMWNHGCSIDSKPGDNFPIFSNAQRFSGQFQL